MPIFYRSDARSPKTIFKIGFNRRSRLSIPELGKHDVNQFAMRNHSSGALDINGQNVISLTRKFESAPIFPTEGSETYVYAIYIPEDQVPKELLDLRENVAYDAHSLEIKNLDKIMSRDYCEKLNFFNEAATLCTFEYFAISIAPEHIICAVKCTRLVQFGENTLEIPTYVKPGELINPFDRKFFVHGEVFNNVRFNASVHTTAKIKQTIIDDFCKKATQMFMTTPVSIGFAGKTILPPAHKTIAEANGYLGVLLSITFTMFSYVLGLKLFDYFQEKIIISNNSKIFITNIDFPKEDLAVKKFKSVSWKELAYKDAMLFLCSNKYTYVVDKRQKQQNDLLVKNVLEVANSPYSIQLHERASQSKIPRKRFNSI